MRLSSHNRSNCGGVKALRPVRCGYAHTGATARICQVPLWQPHASADEIAPIGVGHSVIIENTYNYDYNPGDPARNCPVA